MQRAATALVTRAVYSTAALSLLHVAAAATPDRIYQSDGSILEDVTIVSEGISEVTYKPADSKKTSTVDSDLVLSVEFSAKPEEITLSDVDASQEGFGSALAGMENYLENQGDKKDKKFPWASSYARFRIVELTGLMNDLPAMAAAVDSIIEKDSDSRYLPLAMILKIDRQIANGDLAAAKESGTVFKNLITDKGLTQRWKLEQELLALRADGSKKGADLEKELLRVSKAAAVFPTVTNAADVAAAESMLSRSEFESAEELFRGVTEDTSANNSTLAAAWTGLGDCLYRRAEAKVGADDEGANALFAEAQRAFMRTVVNFRFQYVHVAKSAFYAGRCFQLIDAEGAKDKSNKLFFYVMRNFKGSKWADSARDFQRKN
jgi:hypothetical protein